MNLSSLLHIMYVSIATRAERNTSHTGLSLKWGPWCVTAVTPVFLPAILGAASPSFISGALREAIIVQKLCKSFFKPNAKGTEIRFHVHLQVKPMTWMHQSSFWCGEVTLLRFHTLRHVMRFDSYFSILFEIYSFSHIHSALQRSVFGVRSLTNSKMFWKVVKKRE